MENFVSPVLPLNASDIISFRYKFTKGKVLKSLRIFADAFRLCKLQQKNHYDVILSFQHRSNITLSIAKVLSFVLVKKRMKIITSQRGHRRFNKGSLLYLLYVVTFRFSDSITVNAKEIKDNLVAHYKAKPSRIHVIPNGYDVDQILDRSKERIFNGIEKSVYDNDKTTLITVGRLAKVKNQSFLIDVVSKLPGKYQLIIIGGGELEGSLNEKITRLGLSDRVFLFGEKSNPLPYVKQADIFVFSSLHEGYPNALAEALILKKPIVSLDLCIINSWICFRI